MWFCRFTWDIYIYISLVKLHNHKTGQTCHQKCLNGHNFVVPTQNLIKSGGNWRVDSEYSKSGV